MFGGLLSHLVINVGAATQKLNQNKIHYITALPRPILVFVSLDYHRVINNLTEYSCRIFHI